MKSNLNKGKNNMRYEQKAALQDGNKARMYEEKKKQDKLKQLYDWFSYCEGCDDYFLDHEDCECEQ